MTDDREQRARDPRAISGGSLQEAELQAAPDVAWRATAARSESPFEQGLRRLRRSTTALIGAAIVVLLLVVAIFADVLSPQSPITSDQTHTFERPSRDYPLGTDQLGRSKVWVWSLVIGLWGASTSAKRATTSSTATMAAPIRAVVLRRSRRNP